ncbi:Uncharacterised protein [Candidatus Burarchaeum australiense]|nr:Uncharacterised protein [Candidatus Burarchaeum australiense]
MALHISRSTILWYVVPILAFFIIVIAFFSTPLDLSKVSLNYTARPLSPNVQLQLLPGETYVYEYDLGGKPSNATYSVLGLAGNCMRVSATATGEDAPEAASICIDLRTGQAQDSGLTVDFFQPWMLSLHDNFSWGSASRIVYPKPVEMEDVTNVTVTVVGRGTFRGRDAFKVRATSVRVINGAASDSLEFMLWVDAQKRVLLASDSPPFHIKLVSAPFELANQP